MQRWETWPNGLRKLAGPRKKWLARSLRRHFAREFLRSPAHGQLFRLLRRTSVWLRRRACSANHIQRPGLVAERSGRWRYWRTQTRQVAKQFLRQRGSKRIARVYSFGPQFPLLEIPDSSRTLSAKRATARSDGERTGPGWAPRPESCYSVALRARKI